MPEKTKSPREIIRLATAKWYEYQMEEWSDFSNADETIRQDVARAREHKTYRDKLLGKVLQHVPPLTIEEQQALEVYLEQSPAEVCLTMALALATVGAEEVVR